MFSQVCVCSGGDPRSQIFGGKGSQVSDFWGGSQVSDFRGGSQVSDFFCGGIPGLRFLRGGPRSQIFGGGPRSQIFGGGYLVSVKGKIFDTRFGLIHVQTGENIFVKGTPPLPGIARNCYGHAAGGMPLAFTQEDFLVLIATVLSILKSHLP